MWGLSKVSHFVKEYTYYGVEEANNALKELELKMVKTRDEHWWIPMDPDAESIQIIPLWHDEGTVVRASFGISVLTAVFETVDEARSFVRKLLQYAHVLGELLKLNVYGVLVGAHL